MDQRTIKLRPTIEMVVVDPVVPYDLRVITFLTMVLFPQRVEPVQSCQVVVVDESRSTFDPVLLREQSMLVQGIIQVQLWKTPRL